MNGLTEIEENMWELFFKQTLCRNLANLPPLNCPRSLCMTPNLVKTLWKFYMLYHESYDNVIKGDGLKIYVISFPLLLVYVL